MEQTSANPPTPPVAICILFYEKVTQTIECIQSFLPSSVPIIVCNNGSSAESRQALLDFIRPYPQIQYLEAPSNLGVSGGRNRIIQSSTAPWLFFVDNDITVQTHDWQHKFQRHLGRIPEAEVFIPQLYNVFERTYTPHRNLEVNAGQVSFGKRAHGHSLNLFPGGASLVKRALFERLGFYDERMFVNFEDYELCLRGVISGHPVRAYHIDDILLRHDHRRVANESDRAYVAIRYDHDRTQASAQRIFEKYHLRIKDDAATWSKTQKYKLLHGRKWWSKETLLLLIPASIKKLWNDRK